jgi:hypothetical protein
MIPHGWRTLAFVFVCVFSATQRGRGSYLDRLYRLSVNRDAPFGRPVWAAMVTHGVASHGSLCAGKQNKTDCNR